MNDTEFLEAVDSIIYESLEECKNCIDESWTREYVFGMIDMYLYLNWDNSQETIVVAVINAINTIEWKTINYLPANPSFEEAELASWQVQLLGKIRREIESLLETYEQELI